MAIDDVRLEPARPLPAGPISYDEFLEWADEDTHAEWVDGQVILLHVTVQERHDAIRQFLAFLFGLVISLTGRGSVYGEPFQVWLPAIRRGRAPDLFFLLDENRPRLGKHYLQGPADLIVEITSPESQRRDRVVKLAEYAKAGVPEYWIVDDDARRAEFRVLGPDGHYDVAFDGDAGEYRSTVLPELRLRVEWLWEERPGRDLGDILRTLNLPMP